MRPSLLITGLFILSVITVSGQPKNTIPKYAHIIIVIEENHSYNELIGSENAPYITRLSKGGTLFTDSHGVSHPSQPNYLVLFSGSSQGIIDDNCIPNTPYSTANLGAELIKKGYSFKGFAQTMPYPGFKGCVYLETKLTVGYLYARKHCPWVNWLGTGTNQIPASLSVPMTQFPKNFNKLPTVSFVVPDMDYDMHNIGAPGDAAAIKRGDKWLRENISAYAEWAKTHNSLLIVTFDEDDYNPQNTNRIPTIFYGAKIKSGKYGEPITHFNVLHTVENIYGVTIADTSSAKPIMGVWRK